MEINYSDIQNMTIISVIYFYTRILVKLKIEKRLNRAWTLALRLISQQTTY